MQVSTHTGVILKVVISIQQEESQVHKITNWIIFLITATFYFSVL